MVSVFPVRAPAPRTMQWCGRTGCSRDGRLASEASVLNVNDAQARPGRFRPWVRKRGPRLPIAVTCVRPGVPGSGQERVQGLPVVLAPVSGPDGAGAAGSDRVVLRGR
ncbi:hypothetical protein GCM10010347_42960 [Streptomyces cirratus]|uniref:Uncharacterized protein n=1 Tax=Streptomyces cirratus TaxID=68187 RepID=A0ABQ3EWA0_9ACTN|nr:hypothetical protein GCM10010347_42960 [Streptomyces cirratus]